MLRRMALSCAAVGLLVAASACSSTATSGNSSSSPTTTAAASAVSRPLTAAPTGSVVLTWDSKTKLVTAAVNLSGLTPGSSHAMHIHPGTCADQSQPPSIPFPDITADAAGVAQQTVVSGPVPTGLPTDAYVNVHLAPMASLGSPGQLSFTPISCGGIPVGTAATGPVSVRMSVPPTNGTTPAGKVALRYDATRHSLQVNLTATGLPANSTHAVHIHSGTCDAQGAVRYPLPDLRADATGTATASTTLDNVAQAPPAAGWYVNVHMGPMDQILSNNNPTLLFAPILCANITG